MIGRVTDTGRLVLRMDGEVAADIPVGPLVDEAPVYERPWHRPGPAPDIDPAALPDRDPLACLERLIALPRPRLEALDLGAVRSSGAWATRSSGRAATPRSSGSATDKALALATDCTPRYCRADPVRGGDAGGRRELAQLDRGRRLPLALTDNMNFGNPERPEIMGEFAGVVEGMRAACLALDYPVVSGNVSLYNETSGSAILPTPVIGGVGLIADAGDAVDLALKRDGDALILIGETGGHLGASLYLREIEGREAGPPPPVDLAAERRNGDFVRAADRRRARRRLPRRRRMAGCSSRSPRWRWPAAAASTLDPLPAGCPRNALLFGEDQARYLIETADPRRAPGRGASSRRIRARASARSAGPR